MERAAKAFILNVLDHAKDLTLATVRQDGYPQATAVSYAHDDLTLYVGVGKDSQKADNIRHNPKVSLAITTDYQDWNQIKGLSMGGLAEILTSPEEIRHAADCMIKRFPQLAEWAESGQGEDAVFIKIRPQIISILDYEKGFGHTELVAV